RSCGAIHGATGGGRHRLSFAILRCPRGTPRTEHPLVHRRVPTGLPVGSARASVSGRASRGRAEVGSRRRAMGNVVAVAGNGTGTNGQVTAKIRSYAPATGELIGEVPIATADEVRQVAARVLRFRDAIVDRSDEVVDLLARECGKPRHEALLHEVMVVADIATYFAKNAERILSP